MVGFLMVLIYRSGLLQALFNDSAHQCGCNLSYSIWISFSLLGQLGYTEINLFRQVWVRERDCTRSETGGPFRRVRAVWGGHYCITCWTTQRCTSNRKLSKLSKNLLVLYRDIDTVTPLWVYFFFNCRFPLICSVEAKKGTWTYLTITDNQVHQPLWDRLKLIHPHCKEARTQAHWVIWKSILSCVSRTDMGFGHCYVASLKCVHSILRC